MTVSLKRILWTAAAMALVLIVAAAAVWIGLNKAYKAPSPMRCLTSDAAMVIRLGDRNLLSSRLDSSAYAAELCDLLGGDAAVNLALRVDSLFGPDVINDPVLARRDLYVSFSLNADGSVSKLAAAFPLGNRMEWHHAMSSLRAKQGVSVADTAIHGHGLFILRQAQDSIPLFLAAGGGCLFASTTPDLLLSFGKDSLTTLRDDQSFSTIERTVTADAPASIFINGRLFRRLAAQAPILNGRFAQALRTAAHSADWLALDLSLSSDALAADGFVVAPHPSLDILSAREASESINIARRIPRGVQSIDRVAPGPRGLSSAAFSSFLNSDTSGAAYRNAQSDIFRQSGADVEAMLSQVFSAELALCQYDAAHPAESSFLVVDTRGGTMAQATLAQALTAIHGGASPIVIGEIAPGSSAVPDGVVARRADAQQVSNVSIPVYAGFSASDNLFFLLDIFRTPNLPSRLFFRYEDAIVFANDMSVLRRVLADYAVGNTLEADPSYVSIRQRFGSESARFRMDRQPSQPTFANISSQLTIAGRLPYVSVVAIPNKDDIHAAAHHPSWQTRLDTTVVGQIWGVTNHYTHLTECLAQDANGKVCLIGADGMLLWKRAIDGKIVGPVSQIDFYANGKLQYLFATSQSLYVIDRLGNDVGTFPVRLPSPAVSGASAASYTDGSPIRLFVGCQGGPALYGPDGRTVDGWQPVKTEAQIADVVRHFTCAGKDYIVFNDQYAYYFVDRRGAKRLTTQPLAPGKRSQMTVSKDASYFVTSTTNGSVVKISSPDGNLTSLKLDSIDGSHIALPLPDGNYAVAGTRRAAIVDLSSAQPKALHLWATGLQSLKDMVVADGVIALYDDAAAQARVFSSSTGKELDASPVPTAGPIALGVGTDGPVIFTITPNGEIAQTKLK